MKKLMIAAAIVCAAAISQAASFTWSTGSKVYMPYAIANIKEGADQPSATSSSTKQLSKWIDAGAAFTYTMIIDGNKSSGDIEVSGGFISLTADNAGFEIPSSGDKTINYSIVINGTYNDGSKDWTITSSTIAGSQLLNSLSTYDLSTDTPTSWTIEAVPEPTSGLLLLLGVAGLALKRKQK